MAAARFRIRGRVQGVAYRYATREKARELGPTGWVRNLSDGSVEAAATGDPRQLERFAEWLCKGPAMARVEAVECGPETKPLTSIGFEIRR